MRTIFPQDEKEYYKKQVLELVADVERRRITRGRRTTRETGRSGRTIEPLTILKLKVTP